MMALHAARQQQHIKTSKDKELWTKQVVAVQPTGGQNADEEEKCQDSENNDDDRHASR